MALGALPQNSTNTMHALATMADDISYRIGDRSTSLDWYAKRAMLTGIYVSTGLAMYFKIEYEQSSRVVYADGQVY